MVFKRILDAGIHQHEIHEGYILLQAERGGNLYIAVIEQQTASDQAIVDGSFQICPASGLQVFY